MNLVSECSSVAAGEFMIRSIDIANFKCFERLKIDKVRRINVIVGDNGSGKTALMEAIFLALGSGSELISRYRQQRGLEGGALVGSAQAIEEAYFDDLFFNHDLKRSIRISLDGTATDNRSVKIHHGISQDAVKYFRRFNPSFSVPPSSYKPFVISWIDDRKEERFVIPQFTNQGMQWAMTGEVFPNTFYYASNQTHGAVETAARFSRLSSSFSEGEFKSSIVNEFHVLSDISLELSAGMGVLHATVPSLTQKIPVAGVSGAINRVVSILLAMAATPGCVILVDEMENGIYYTHQKEVWRTVLRSARENRCQVITSTHSIEWLRAMIEAADGDTSDIALWRFELDDNRRLELFAFDGETLKDGIEYGADPRGSK